MSDFGAFTADDNADIGIQRANGGVGVRDVRVPAHWAIITGGSNPYSHVSAAPELAGGNTAMPSEPPFEYGTADSWPAYEQNGSTSVDAGTLVWLEPEFLTPGYRFLKPASGHGSGSGSTVGGCCPNESRVVDVRCVGDDLVAFTVTNDASGNPGPQVPSIICAGICADCTTPPEGSCTVPLPCPPDVCIPVATTPAGTTTTPVTVTGVGGTVWTGGTNPSGTITIATGRAVFTYPNGDQVFMFPDAGYQPQDAAFSLTYPRQIYAPAGGHPVTVIEGTVTALRGSCTPPTCGTVAPDTLPGTLNFVTSSIPAPCATTNATYVGTAAGAGLSRHWDTTSIPCSFSGGTCDPLGPPSGANQLKLSCVAGVYTLTAITGMGAPCNAVGTGPYAATSGEASPFMLTFTVAACLFITGATGTCTVVVSV